MDVIQLTGVSLARRKKKVRDPKYTRKFVEAVYPGYADIMIASFDEEAVLTDATAKLDETPSQRWTRMRKWVSKNLETDSTTGEF